MTDDERIEIGKSFIECHKNRKLSDWGGSHFLPANAVYLRTYYNLISGLFGTLNYICEGKRSVKIGSEDSKKCFPVVFTWDFEENEVTKK